MRHDRLTTTEQYMAYAPQPELAEPDHASAGPPQPARERHADPSRPRPASFLERLEEEIPAKWLREVRRVYAETEKQVLASIPLM